VLIANNEFKIVSVLWNIQWRPERQETGRKAQIPLIFPP
jgi:hypothetical protein